MTSETQKRDEEIAQLYAELALLKAKLSSVKELNTVKCDMPEIKRTFKYRKPGAF